MKDETERYFAKSRSFLLKAEKMLAVDMVDEAGRAAYLAGFHAAQAFIFENVGVVAKTHSGVRSWFAELVRSNPDFDIALRPFLGRAYNMKTIVDYETGSAIVSRSETEAMLATARRFVDNVAALIPPVVVAPPRDPGIKP
jgi:uncharacterized protein (UPF0332 family)